MLKDITYSQKLTILKNWISTIVEEIKKDIKQEHLKFDRQFTKTYFPSANLSKITVQELASGYILALENNDKAEEIGEFFANRWLLKNTDMYHLFEDRLKKISPDFTELQVLEEQDARNLMEDSIKEFGAIKTYLFVVLNSVVFPESTLNELKTKAEEEYKTEKENKAIQAEEAEQRSKERNFELQLARITDKYEKKLLGLEKKYHTDISALKKQVATLHKKLEEKN